MELSDWILGQDPNCIVCGKDILPSKFGLCPSCLEEFPFAERLLDEKALTVCRYEGPVKDLIYNYKYNQNRVLGKYMANMMAERVKHSRFEYDGILTVPCSKKRKIVRGFDHTLYMGQILSDNLGIDLYKDTLKRVKETRRLKGLSKEERLAELENAFVVQEDNGIYGKRLLLIDDILTTGATLSACTQAVLPYEPACVHWLSFAAVFQGGL